MSICLFWLITCTDTPSLPTPPLPYRLSSDTPSAGRWHLSSPGAALGSVPERGWPGAQEWGPLRYRQHEEQIVCFMTFHHQNELPNGFQDWTKGLPACTRTHVHLCFIQKYYTTCKFFLLTDHSADLFPANLFTLLASQMHLPFCAELIHM